jgi:hypothetical protein
MMYRFLVKITLGIAALLLAGPVLAQSPFAITNMGQRLDPDDSRMVGRGGWGMALSDSLHPGFKNVAGLSAVRHVVVKYTGYGDHVRATDDQDQRHTNRTISPDLRLALPIIKGKLVFSTGFEVYRSTHYQTFTPLSWYAWGDTITGNEQFIREGSMWQVPMGLSLEVIPGLSLGATVGLVNGSISETVLMQFITPNNGAQFPSPLYSTNLQVKEDNYKGTAVTWSVLMKPTERFSLGGSWRQAHELDVDRKVSMFNVAQRSYTTWTYSLPDEYRAGFDLRLTGRWHLGGDYQLMKFWGGNGKPEWQDDLTHEHTYSVGLERTQRYQRNGGKGNLPLRLGYQQRQWGYEVGGNPVKEEMFSVGTGFPFRQKMGQVDMALSYGHIGSLADNGQESKIWRFTLSITGLESWW